MRPLAIFSARDYTEPMVTAIAESAGDVWFVYDGDCPLCSSAAHALRIRKAVGELHLVNARVDSEHPVLCEVNRRGMNLDEGMVIYYGDRYYHGADVLHIMALLGTGQGWFNRLNAMLFRSKPIAFLCYPPMRATRNLLLRFKGVGQLNNLKTNGISIFQPIFGAAWDALPPVMQQHYAVRAGSRDQVTVEGIMQIERSAVARLMSPLLRLCGALVPYSGHDIPVTVHFSSPPGSSSFRFDRIFHFPGKPPVHFRSRMEPVGGGDVIEFMRLGIGWHTHIEWDGQRLQLHHKGYVWRIFGLKVPLPLTWLIGKGEAWEEPLSAESFRMWMATIHPWFGTTYSYSGVFRVTQVTHG